MQPDFERFLERVGDGELEFDRSAHQHTGRLHTFLEVQPDPLHRSFCGQVPLAAERGGGGFYGRFSVTDGSGIREILLSTRLENACKAAFAGWLEQVGGVVGKGKGRGRGSGVLGAQLNRDGFAGNRGGDFGPLEDQLLAHNLHRGSRAEGGSGARVEHHFALEGIRGVLGYGEALLEVLVLTGGQRQRLVGAVPL